MKRIICVIFITSLLLSCETNDDPTSETANVVFWTKRSDVYYSSPNDFNIIDVQLENFSTSRSVFFGRNTAPDCIEDEDATFYFFRPGSYKMTAQDTKGRTWKGTITIGDGCNQIELK